MDRERQPQIGEEDEGGVLGMKGRWVRMRSSVFCTNGCLLDVWVTAMAAQAPAMEAPAAVRRRWEMGEEVLGVGLIGGGNDEKGKRSDAIVVMVVKLVTSLQL